MPGTLTIGSGLWQKMQTRTSSEMVFLQKDQLIFGYLSRAIGGMAARTKAPANGNWPLAHLEPTRPSPDAVQESGTIRQKPLTILGPL